MTDQLVSFETAKLAKEKGFNEPCRYFITLPSKTLHDNAEDVYVLESGEIEDVFNSTDYKYSAPTQSLLQKWLREEHNLLVEIEGVNCHIDICFIKYYTFRIIGNKWLVPDDEYGTYEEALEAGLQEALQLIKI